jgi:hypothetical protein
MDHHEQHHQHHQKEREHHIKQQKEHEHQTEKLPGRIHPLWFLVLGTVLLGLVALTWILVVPVP